jgi:hypothetical protein
VFLATIASAKCRADDILFVDRVLAREQWEVGKREIGLSANQLNVASRCPVD